MEPLQAINDSVVQHIGWALALLGGTLLTIVGTSHVSPKSTLGRSMYFLFVPAWTLLSLSLYYGDRVQRHVIAALMVDEEHLAQIHYKINSDYKAQSDFLLYAGGFLIAWLLTYMFWWIFFRKEEVK